MKEFAKEFIQKNPVVSLIGFVAATFSLTNLAMAVLYTIKK